MVGPTRANQRRTAARAVDQSKNPQLQRRVQVALLALALSLFAPLLALIPTSLSTASGSPLRRTRTHPQVTEALAPLVSS